MSFDLGLPGGARRNYWPVFEPGGVDIRVGDPGLEIDLWVTAELRTLVAVWLGHRLLRAALAAGELLRDGPEAERRAFRACLAGSHFAGAGRAPAALSTRVG